MMKNTTPNQITETIRSFCKEIDPSREPLFVPVVPGEKCRPNACMNNVPEYQKENGGAVQHGWTIWEIPGQLLEAEFHAVWKSPQGEFIDITPALDGEDKRLFLPDSKRVYEHQLLENIRKPLSDSPEIKAIIENSKMLFQIRKRHFKNGEIDFDGLMSELQNMQENTFIKKRNKTGRNEPCPCGSGVKYKKCCGL